jgi:hypothetical protein
MPYYTNFKSFWHSVRNANSSQYRYIWHLKKDLTHPELKFSVTEIGCGIAGFTPDGIVPLVKLAIDENIKNAYYLPESFVKIIQLDFKK